MKLISSLVSIIALWISVMAAAGAAPTTTGDAALRDALQADLQNYLNARSKIEHISAASLSINLRGMDSNINVAAGQTRYAGSDPVSPANLFQIGSNTKAFTSVAILQLEAEKKLSIDQTVGRWLPQYPAWKSVTIRQLLNMTSGIPSYDRDQPMLRAYAANPYAYFTTARLVAFVYPKNGSAPPKTSGWAYTNTAYILAQMIIERASGRSYTSELDRRFLRSSLNLNDTYYEADRYPQRVTSRMVSGYFVNSGPGNAGLAPLLGKDVRTFSISWAQGAGGIVATPEDVTRWSRALFEGPLLAPQQRRELMSIVSDKTGKPLTTTTLHDPAGFGLGVAQRTFPQLGKIWYYEGETLGYRMLYVWLPKSDAVIAVALNSQPLDKEDGVGKLIAAVYETLHRAGKV